MSKGGGRVAKGVKAISCCPLCCARILVYHDTYLAARCTHQTKEKPAGAKTVPAKNGGEAKPTIDQAKDPPGRVARLVFCYSPLLRFSFC